MLIREGKPLCSIDHVVKEVGNAVWRHCWLRGAIDKAKATKLYQVLLKLINTGVITLEPETNYVQTALQIALEHGITLYDSLYIAQAQKHGELLISDKKQAKIATKLGIKVHMIITCINLSIFCVVSINKI
ncbi:MAG: type II toxin-antitoxin system VapC family toxin [Thermoproteales archaeon]|nr:type II toxin-antitoxin system VapC family toxin [Thermoproteales archaeon]